MNKKVIPQIPGLEYPFPDMINPLVSELERQTKNWIYKDYSSIPQAIKLKYEHTYTGHLTARFFPLASYDRLIPLARSSIWGLVFDDYYEHCTPYELDELRKNIVGVILGDLPNPVKNIFYVQMKLMAEEFRKIMPIYWIERFAKSMDIYIHGMAEEAIYKANLIFPDPEEYMRIREMSVDVLQMIDGIEVETGMPLPSEIREHPILKKIASITCRMIAICNDCFSAAKEKDRDVMNLVLVLQHTYHLSFNEAIQEAIKMHNEDLKLYLDLYANRPDFGSYNEAVNKFLQYNNLMIAGHWRWYTTDTYRYLPGGHPNRDDFRHNQ
jgi:hypothetical protein